MLKKILKTLGFLVAAIAAVSIVNPFLAYRLERYDPVDFGKFYEYSGVIGVHSSSSEGSNGYEKIGKICDSQNLYFAIVVDTSSVGLMTKTLGERYGMTLMIPGVEIAGPRSGERYVVIGDSIPVLPTKQITIDAAVSGAARKGSLVILGGTAQSVAKLPGHAQTDIDATAMDLYNFNENWKSLFSITQINKFIGAYLDYSIDPRTLNYIIRYPEKNIREFDMLNGERRIVGLGAIGTRSVITLGRDKQGQFPTYESVFRLIQTVIVTTTPYNALYHHDLEITLDALKNGHAYVAFSGLEPARGFFFTAASGDRHAMMGDSLRLDGTATIHITLPDSNDVETRLIKDGKVIRSYSDSGTATLTVNTTGQYRIEVFQKRLMLPFFMKRLYPWILSNPIYIYKD